MAEGPAISTQQRNALTPLSCGISDFASMILFETAEKAVTVQTAEEAMCIQAAETQQPLRTLAGCLR